MSKTPDEPILANNGDNIPRIKTAKSIKDDLVAEEPVSYRVLWANVIYDWDTRSKKIQLVDDPLPKDLPEWTRVYRVEINLPPPVEADKTTDITAIKPPHPGMVDLQGEVIYVDNEKVPEGENFAYTIGRRLYLVGNRCAPGGGTYESHWTSPLDGRKQGPCSFTVQKQGKRVRVTIEEY